MVVVAAPAKVVIIMLNPFESHKNSEIKSFELIHVTLWDWHSMHIFRNGYIVYSIYHVLYRV